jgi:hypothetical protein
MACCATCSSGASIDSTPYRAEDGEAPTRWPVFLRTEGDHLSPFGELYQGLDELQRGIAGAIDRGIPVCRLLIVEFAAEPVRPGLYRKLASFRVGKATFAEVCVHDTQWIAKAGQKGIATDELYDDELRIVRDNPHGPDLAAAFDIAGIEYGRADFGLVGGNVQVYEINSNPTIGLGGDHPNASRMKSYQQFRENYTAALRAIDTPT